MLPYRSGASALRLRTPSNTSDNKLRLHRCHGGTWPRPTQPSTHSGQPGRPGIQEAEERCTLSLSSCICSRMGRLSPQAMLRSPSMIRAPSSCADPHRLASFPRAATLRGHCQPSLNPPPLPRPKTQPLKHGSPWRLESPNTPPSPLDPDLPWEEIHELLHDPRHKATDPTRGSPRHVLPLLSLRLTRGTAGDRD